jgi:hypothetical protein
MTLMRFVFIFAPYAAKRRRSLAYCAGGGEQETAGPRSPTADFGRRRASLAAPRQSPPKLDTTNLAHPLQPPQRLRIVPFPSDSAKVKVVRYLVLLQRQASIRFAMDGF